MTTIPLSKIKKTSLEPVPLKKTLIAQEMTDLRRLDRKFFRNRSKFKNLFLAPAYPLKIANNYCNSSKLFLEAFCAKFAIEDLSQWTNTLIFDSENYQSYRYKAQIPVVLCGVYINSQATVFGQVWIIKNLLYPDLFSPRMIKAFQTFISNHKISTVGSHGGNKEEFELIEPLKKLHVNTARCLRLLKKNDIIPKHIGGLKQFETWIGYTRLACGFFKHKKWKWQMWFQAMHLSLQNHLTHVPQRICLCCRKPQDVVQYCYEDAFVAFLIYILYKKHETAILSKKTIKKTE